MIAWEEADPMQPQQQALAWGQAGAGMCLPHRLELNHDSIWSVTTQTGR
jgi:hypothetical protein